MFLIYRQAQRQVKSKKGKVKETKSWLGVRG
jgi:hypothetical protein